MSDPTFLAIHRFDDCPADQDAIRVAVDVLSGAAGFISADIGQCTDSAALQVLVMRWASIGAYRKALSQYAAKLTAVPVLSQAVDEPGGYEVIAHTEGQQWHLFDSGLAADAFTVSLGQAAAAAVPPITSAPTA